MTAPGFDRAVQQAVQRGLLPQGATVLASEGRPWPVALLTVLGAWLSAVPLLAVVGLLLDDLLQRGAGLYLVAGLLLAAAAVTLRSRGVRPFLEQLAVPVLLSGLLSLAWALFRDLGDAPAGGVLTLACLGLAVAVPLPWLRAVLGAAAAMAAVQALTAAQGLGAEPWDGGFAGTPAMVWLALHAVLAASVGALLAQARLAPRPRAVLEAVHTGWLLAALAGLAWWSGRTFLLGAGLLGGGMGETLSSGLASGLVGAAGMRLVSLLGAIAAAAWAALRWPALGRPWCAAAAVPLAGLAWALPSLGACLLVLALSATSARRGLAIAAALAAAWIVGAFYYALDWPLLDKGLMLMGGGAVLGAVALWAARAPAGVSAPAAAGVVDTRRSRLGVALGALALLAVVNLGIWQKETLIAEGRPVFVALAPVDPRSLMQGDYMALRFALPEVDAPAAGLWRAPRPWVWARLDARGVATLRAPSPGAPAAQGEVRIELTPRDGGWMLVTDAWHFPEGEADRWAGARFGEFRVDPRGRALLVGLRDERLRPL